MIAPFTAKLVAALNQLLDQHCLLCQHPSQRPLCDCCSNDIAGFDLNRCGGNVLYWPRLQQGLKSKEITRLTAIGPHQWPLSRLVGELKFSARPYVACALAELFVQRTQGVLVRPDAIIPVPLHPWRLLTRHYNQSALLAADIGRRINIHVDMHCCRRVGHRPPQTMLSGRKRRSNLRRCFSALPLPYEHVALVDDVITTGTTMTVLSRAIRQANPGIRIDHWCLSVSVPYGSVPTDR